MQAKESWTARWALMQVDDQLLVRISSEPRPFGELLVGQINAVGSVWSLVRPHTCVLVVPLAESAVERSNTQGG